MQLLKTYRRALSYLWPEKQAFLAICIANIILAIITIAEPILFGRVIDAVAEKTDVVTTLAIWVGFGIFNIVAYVLVARGADRLTHRHRLGIIYRSFERIISMPLSWHHQCGTSHTLHTLIRATDSLATIWLEFMRQHLSTIVALVGLIPTALIIEWRLFMVLVVLGSIYIMITRLVMRKTKDSQASIEYYHHTLFEHISDSISNVAVVQGYNRIREEAFSLRNQTEDLLKMQYPVLNWWALASGLNRMASTISIVIVLLLGAFLVTHGQLQVGNVVAFVGFAQLMIGRLDQMSTFINLTVSAHARLEEFFAMEDSTISILEPEKLPNLTNVKGLIKFEHVTYEFIDSCQGIYDVSFDVKPGQTVAIVGPTGSGKTTLVNLLQRIYDPAAGHISIDGIDIRTVSRESLRESLSTVFQDAGLLNRSIGTNIRMGRGNASKEEVYNAAKTADAHSFIMDKSENYATLVGERGSKLSGGEQQRIAIARAVLKNAPILVLDEATSALDVETEKRVKEALDTISQNRTTFVIAHRLSTVKNADLVLFLNQGRLIEKGSFRELAIKGGRFTELLHAAGLITNKPQEIQGKNNVHLSKKNAS